MLSLPLAEVLGVLGTACGSTSTIRRLLLPFVYLRAGKEAAKAFGSDGELATDEDVAAALGAIAERLPMAPAELLDRAKDAASVEALALSIDADLAALNPILAELGPPYKAIDRTAAHEMALAAFLTRQSALIRESIRARYRLVWDQHGDLAPYRAALATAPLTLPAGIGLTHGVLPQAMLQGWLTQWLADLGVTPIAEIRRRARRLTPCERPTSACCARWSRRPVSPSSPRVARPSRSAGRARRRRSVPWSRQPEAADGRTSACSIQHGARLADGVGALGRDAGHDLHA